MSNVTRWYIIGHIKIFMYCIWKHNETEKYQNKIKADADKLNLFLHCNASQRYEHLIKLYNNTDIGV